MREAIDIRMAHRFEITERVWIGERPMLFEPLLFVGALRIIKAACVAAVVTGKRATLRIHLETKRVAAAFGENFKTFRRGMVPPDQLTEEMHRFGVRTIHARANNVASGCAAAGAIKPAIRSPAQAVRHR